MVSLFKQPLFMKQRAKLEGNEILGCSPIIMQLCEGGPYMWCTARIHKSVENHFLYVCSLP